MAVLRIKPKRSHETQCRRMCGMRKNLLFWKVTKAKYRYRRQVLQPFTSNVDGSIHIHAIFSKRCINVLSILVIPMEKLDISLCSVALTVDDLYRVWIRLPRLLLFKVSSERPITFDPFSGAWRRNSLVPLL